MKRLLFGTDGIRGIAGQAPMDEETVFRLGRAAACFFEDRCVGLPSRTVVIGRDTRGSGQALGAAAGAGFASGGWEVIDAGITPTPAIAFAVREWKSGAGGMVTASHNPASYNGLKLFGPGGRKLTDEEEASIELIFHSLAGKPVSRNGPRPFSTRDAGELYARHLGGLLKSGELRGWRLVVDCANGAAATTAPGVLGAFGAEVDLIGVSPDGDNINVECGSEHPERMATSVRANAARLGLAFDGDGDRLVVADETGNLLAGDELLAVLAFYGNCFGWLRHGTLAATVMANLGLDEMMESIGGRVIRTAVGDRHVAEAMREHGLTMGGESSGHLLFPEIGPGGDGLAGALTLISILLRTGEPLSRLRRCLNLYPQKTARITVGEKPPLETLPTLATTIREVERALGQRGRVLVRYSGTEPLLRFLVEGRDSANVERFLFNLVEAATRDLSPVEG